MGVHGLWKLIDKAGRPIPVETLENKVLAVDVSIWLYQLVRGFDSSARPGGSAFLLGLFHRICKLLFYRIKPVFVFDGGVPSLKKKQS
ncbi:XPGN [Nesidiocoris tenuis]|uniref:XPGN n=1 Tax=Nesidiocoris tenuis TaxID=355587 RepID=A0ABN7AC12_9HEMI|nr:XPGN [Nesidiocoris tenuis]